MRAVSFILLAIVGLMPATDASARADASVAAEITISAGEWRYYGLPRVVYYSRYRVKGRVCRWPLGGIAICLDQGRYGFPALEERLVCRYTDHRPYLREVYHGLGLSQAYVCGPPHR